MPVLSPPQWTARRAAHEARVDRLVGAHLERRRRGARHPVEDFLFSYYTHRPAQLRRWHPGAGVVLAAADPADFPAGYQRTADGIGLTVDVPAALARAEHDLRAALAVLTGTASRPAQLGCFGLHEWAMVYREPPERIRHPGWPLRLPADQIAAAVQQSRLRCTHVDAYRFFSQAARPLNLIRPTRDQQHRWEQPGCLHANMDLYKWAYKLGPLVASELVLECFLLARDIRELDMRASPYDLSALGYSPVRIETIEGRHEYVLAQQWFAERAAPLRSRLIAECDRLLAASGR